MGQQHPAPWSTCGPTDGRDGYANAFRRDGYYLHEGVLSSDEVETLRRAVAEIPQGEEVRRRQSVYGVRNLLKICPAVRQLAADPRIRQFVTPILGDAAFAVRAIFFDKAPGGNWSLFWHQDNVVAVAERREAPEFVGWSQKAGVWQVQPPAEVLANMVAVRVHLDDSTALNGPLRVLPSSHRHGWIEDVDEWKQNVREVVCTVGCGGVVIMRPLTLHASAASESTAHRRVIHIEYAAEELPHGLAWSDRIGPNGGEPVALARE
jgi:ectoine hydroxylase-related dioxygenase (phytanoyl-CoA dioxygenase family)